MEPGLGVCVWSMASISTPPFHIFSKTDEHLLTRKHWGNSEWTWVNNLVNLLKSATNITLSCRTLKKITSDWNTSFCWAFVDIELCMISPRAPAQVKPRHSENLQVCQRPGFSAWTTTNFLELYELTLIYNGIPWLTRSKWSSLTRCPDYCEFTNPCWLD